MDAILEGGRHPRALGSSLDGSGCSLMPAKLLFQIVPSFLRDGEREEEESIKRKGEKKGEDGASGNRRRTSQSLVCTDVDGALASLFALRKKLLFPSFVI